MENSVMENPVYPFIRWTGFCLKIVSHPPVVSVTPSPVPFLKKGGMCLDHGLSNRGQVAHPAGTIGVSS